MKLLRKVIASAALIFAATGLHAQSGDFGQLSGNFQIEAQTYKKDSLIGAKDVKEKILSSGFLNLNYKLGNFNVGLRYENYQNPILGIDQRYKGSGIAYRYASYSSDRLDVTAGNFYEQFGSGIILRSYEEKALGFDNALDGLRLKFRPASGIQFTGLVGKQRSFWSTGDGIVRAADMDVSVNDLFGPAMEKEIRINLGGSIVSVYQADNESFYNLPENVFAYSTRFGLAGSCFNFDAEYAYKYNDPKITNNYSYAPGKGLILSGSYFIEGFGIAVNAHSIDNMDFRSDRTARGNMLTMNYIPAITRQHAYRLATLYPYATQLKGEAGVQADVNYKFKNGSLLGGKYGTQVNANFSIVKGINQKFGADTVFKELKYTSSLFDMSDRLYFRDFNFEISKKWSKEFKTGLTFISEIYDRDIVENEGSPKYGKVNSNIVVLELSYKIAPTQSLRCELQHAWAKQDSAIHTPDNSNGNWLFGLLEYTIAPSWYITVYDEYNYGNDSEDLQLHYLNYSVAYAFETSRLQVSYGRQRGGILCVGGVCRPVPASNGLYLCLTTSF